MKEEKTPKQKPHTSFNRRLSVAKNPEGNMTTAKKNVKNVISQGNMTKMEYGKGYYGNKIKFIIELSEIFLKEIFLIY